MMKVTVIGGGNIGMCLVGEISRIKGYDVTLYTSTPEVFDKQIKVMDDEREITYLSGSFLVTDDLEIAVRDADMILCTVPAFMRKSIIEKMENVIKESAFLGFFPGYGGAEYYCDKLLKRGITIFAVQKVPYVARTKEKGKIAGLMSKKPSLFIAAMPKQQTDVISRIVEDMLLIKCHVLNNYMETTLLPGNPLLHTSGSYVFLKNYKEGDIFSSPIYYYQSWDDECSRVICDFSDELHAICKKIPIDLSGVKTIQEYYEADTPEKLTAKFHTIPSFKPLLLPMKEVSNGYIPDFSSRFYIEDIPYGVCIIKALALLVKIKTPTIDTILNWYTKMTGKVYFEKDDSFGKDIRETAIPQLFGITSVEDLKQFYIQ